MMDDVEVSSSGKSRMRWMFSFPTHPYVCLLVVMLCGVVRLLPDCLSLPPNELYVRFRLRLSVGLPVSGFEERENMVCFSIKERTGSLSFSLCGWSLACARNYMVTSCLIVLLCQYIDACFRKDSKRHCAFRVHPRQSWLSSFLGPSVPVFVFVSHFFLPASMHFLVCVSLSFFPPPFPRGEVVEFHEGAACIDLLLHSSTFI
mmetsp:Transcript_23103/g.45452  ORF Transcript_23103/g.45452 Transcript_23103/m.45452 type:complete len:203 (+) Transcript_23103:1694-2302(+)